MGFSTHYPNGCPEGTHARTCKYYRFQVKPNISNFQNHQAPASRNFQLEEQSCEAWGLSGYLSETAARSTLATIQASGNGKKWRLMYYNLTPNIGEIKHTPLADNPSHYDLYTCDGASLADVAVTL